MPQRFCTRCGAPVTRRFCTRCGAEVRQPDPEAAEATADAQATPGSGAPTTVPPLAEPPGSVPPETAPRRRRRAWIATGTGLALLLGGVVAGAVVLADDDGPAHPAGAGASVEPEVSVLGEPRQEWEVRAEDVVDEPGATFYDAFSRADGDSLTPLVLSDLVVMGVSAYDSMTERSSAWLVGLDPATGDERWVRSLPEDVWTTCTVTPDEERLACIENRWIEDSDESEVSLVLRNTGDGRELDRRSVESWVADVVAVDDEVWTASMESDPTTDVHLLRVERVSVDDLDDRIGSETRLVGEEYAGETGLRLDTDGERVWVGLAGTSYEVDRSSGDLEEDEGSVLVGTDDAGQPAVFRTAAEQSWLEGEARFDGWPWGYVAGRQQVYGDLYGVGDMLLRRGSADPVRTVVGENANAAWVNGDVLRVESWTDDASEVRFEAARSGEVLWYDRENRWTWASTADAYLSFTPDSDHFDVRSAWSGDLAWSRELPVTTTGSDGNSYASTLDISTWSGGVVVTSGDTMFGFTDFADPDPELLRRPAGVEATPDGTDPDAAGPAGQEESLELGDDYVTACGSEPEFVPVSSEGVAGSVEVTFEVTATCPSGQWLDSPAYRIDLTAEDADGGVPLASGRFDFSEDRVWIPAEGTSQVTAGFPVRQVWATPEEIGDFIARGAVLVACLPEEPGSEEELAPADPNASDSGGAASTDDVTDPDTREENSLRALRRIAAQDKSHVLESLAGKWLPQLSSKQDGTHDRVDEKTYDYTAIYEEHLRLRLSYPDVRLLWSGDWGSFERPDYWVTVVGRGARRPKPALDWCAGSGRAPSQCYAKLIRLAGPHEGTTRLQR